MCESSNITIRLYSILLWKQRCPHLFRNHRDERMFVVDSGVFMHVLSKRDLSSAEMDTLRRPRTSVTMVTANGEVQTTQKSTSICSRSGPLRVCAIARGNANSIIAWKAFRRTRIFKGVFERSRATIDQQWDKVFAHFIFSFFLLYQVCHPFPQAVRLQQRERRI